MSEKITVFQAVNKVMRAVDAVGKGEKNQSQGWNFRGIDGVLNAVGPALREHGVIAVPSIEDEIFSTVQTSKGASMNTTKVKMRVRWYGPEGDHFDSVTWGESFDSGDKSAAKAHSVAFRTALIQTLALPTQEPDPDSFTYQIESAQERAQREAEGAEREREARRKDLNDWAANLERFEKQQDVEQVKAGIAWADGRDREKYELAQGVLQRMLANQPTPEQAQEAVQDELGAQPAQSA